MTDNELLLLDRTEKIRQVIEKYGEENFYISFSGGKDSTVLSWLIDYALPNNKIPRVFADTGIELNMIRDFVLELAESDKRVTVIKPTIPIKQMLEKEGYPFKSKQHSKWLDNYQRKGKYWAIKNYLGEGDKTLYRPCPQKLKYQFSDNFKIRVSDKCCWFLKEKPLDDYIKASKRKYAITGIMREEGGRRMHAQCLAFKGDKFWQFHPLAIITKEWEEWLIATYNIKICAIYNPPYNFVRTGCKGCPFSLNLQHDLDVLEKHFPQERKQCEIIWKPIYDEYRRIGYRLKKDRQLSFDDIKEV